MTIQPADLYFTTGGSIFSKAVKYITHSEWSHVEVIVDVPSMSVVSADAGGIYCREIREDEKPKHAILTYPKMTPEEREIVCRFCLSQVGKQYDYAGIGDFLFDTDMQNEDRWFCSELGFVAYLKAGIKLLERVDHCFVSPELLYISPLLWVVEEEVI